MKKFVKYKEIVLKNRESYKIKIKSFATSFSKIRRQYIVISMGAVSM